MNQAKVTQLASDGMEMKEGTKWNGEQEQMGGFSVAESGLRCLEEKEIYLFFFHFLHFKEHWLWIIG